MARKKKQFCPHIYAEWGELFDAITEKERSEILLAITKFPEYEPVNIPIWNFIKSQLQKDYELFVEKCEKNGEISRNYWQNKKTNDIESNRTDTERYPKLKHKLLTKIETKTEINQDENQLENQDANQEPNQVVDIDKDMDKDNNIDNLFNNFYNKYPNKKSKTKALVSFKKALKKVSFEKLMDGLEKYLKEIEIKKTEKQYIKHPATWLNQGCWDDEYEQQKTIEPQYHNARL